MYIPRRDLDNKNTSKEEKNNNFLTVNKSPNLPKLYFCAFSTL